MALPAILRDSLRVPLIGAPMFIVSQPDLVVAQCTSGIVGSFPALNARPQSLLKDWIHDIQARCEEHRRKHPDEPVAPFAVNQICHNSNTRLREDLETCAEEKVPIIITSLRPPDDVVTAVHSYGGLVFHDVISLRHAEKAMEQGVDGIIAVCAGAGGHAGNLSPFALVKEIRKIFDGTLILSGAMSNGQDIVAARAMGADLAYFGTRFIATREAHAVDAYKQMIVDSSAKDIVYTSLFTGVHGSYLKGSIANAGLDPDNLDEGNKAGMNFAKSDGAKAWKDIWGAGQGVGTVEDIPSARELILRIESEYRQTISSLRA